MKILIFFSLSLISYYAFASEKIVSLKEAIQLVKSNNLEVKLENFKAMAAATDLTLIKGETRPQISVLTGLGPINGKKGDYTKYDDQKTWGTMWITSIETKIPMYMWGRENDLNHAANLNIEIQNIDVTKKQNEIIFKLKEAYYGWQYALSLLDFVNDTEKDLNNAIKALENKTSKKEDLFRLEVFKYQIEEKKVQIEKNIRLARMGVNFYINNEFSFDQKSARENERQWIELDSRELKDFEYYSKILNEDYPDLLKVSKGIEAKSYLYKSEYKARLPVFGGLFKYDHAATDQRSSQKNPFIYDPYNHNYFAIGVGLTWDIDFGIKKSKQDKLTVEIAELKSKEHFAKIGLQVLLNKAYLDVEESEKRTQALQKAYKTAKKWLTNIETSVGLGLTPAKDIIDAYTTRALVYKDYYESLYNYQMAWAKLSEAVGSEVDPILTK